MNEKPVIFISHSSKDKARVNILKLQLENVLHKVAANIFNTSHPDTIPISRNWFSEMLTNLEMTKSFIVVVSSASRTSPYVNFEIGYFWKINEDRRKSGKDEYPIYPLSLGNESMFGPLTSIESKSLDKPEEMRSFFATLGNQFGIDITELDVDGIISMNKPKPQFVMGKHNLYPKREKPDRPRS